MNQYHLPFGLGVPHHSIAYKVDLLPAFSPFMSVTFLGTHVANFQMVAPTVRVLFLILDTVPFDGPFPRALPFHDSAALVGPKDDNEFAASTQPGIAAVSASYICSSH